jgi:hypothetical protein
MKKVLALILLVALAAALLVLPHTAGFGASEPAAPATAPTPPKEAAPASRVETPAASESEVPPAAPQAPATVPDAGAWREYFG